MIVWRACLSDDIPIYFTTKAAAMETAQRERSEVIRCTIAVPINKALIVDALNDEGLFDSQVVVADFTE